MVYCTSRPVPATRSLFGTGAERHRLVPADAYDGTCRPVFRPGQDQPFQTSQCRGMVAGRALPDEAFDKSYVQQVHMPDRSALGNRKGNLWPGHHSALSVVSDPTWASPPHCASAFWSGSASLSRHIAGRRAWHSLPSPPASTGRGSGDRHTSHASRRFPGSAFSIPSAGDAARCGMGRFLQASNGAASPERDIERRLNMVDQLPAPRRHDPSLPEHPAAVPCRHPSGNPPRRALRARLVGARCAAKRRPVVFW